MNTVRENLIAARKLIDTPEKWIKGNLSSADDSCFCALGAISIRNGRWISIPDDEAEALVKAIPPSFPTDGFRHRVAHYNDHPDTTHADILALFDSAISAQEPSNAE